MREPEPVVDAEHQPAVLHLVGVQRHAFGPQQIEGLRQIQLALGVLRGEPRQDPPEGLGLEGEDAGVHLAYLLLLRRRVAGLQVRRRGDDEVRCGGLVHWTVASCRRSAALLAWKSCASGMFDGQT